MQLTFSLNIEIDRINVFMNNSNKNIINLDIMQAINIILDFKNNLGEYLTSKNIKSSISKNYIEFTQNSINDKSLF